MIVEFARIQDYKDWREGAYARDKLTIWANAPSPLLPKVVCKKKKGWGGGVFPELAVLGWLRDGDCIVQKSSQLNGLILALNAVDLNLGAKLL